MEKQVSAQQSSQTKDYPMRIVSVVFGNPRSPECAGYGLCKLDEDGDIPPMGPPPKRGLLTCGPRHKATVERLETADGKVSLVFNFEKSALNADVIKTYFSDGHFIMGSTLQLPINLIQAFDMHSSALKAGLYDINETKNQFSIQIQTT
jgi:hypothetical protein